MITVSLRNGGPTSPSRTRKRVRTIKGAYAYRTITFYTVWHRHADSRVPYGYDSDRKPRKRTEVFQTLYPVGERVASANGVANLRKRNGNDWSATVVIAEYLTDGGWQPIDHALLFPEVFGQ